MEASSPVKIQPSLPEMPPGFMRHLAARTGCGQGNRRKDQDEKHEMVPRAPQPLQRDPDTPPPGADLAGIRELLP